MQLLIILALLLYGGKSGAGNILSEMKPVLESMGGEEMEKALKSAKEILPESPEEISSVINAVQAMSKPSPPVPDGDGEAVHFPLEPISSIADKDITYSLSKYIAAN